MKIPIKKIIFKLKTQLKIDKDSDLAKAMGVNRATFSSWKNRNAIDFSILVDFCKKKSISLDWLFELEESKNAELVKALKKGEKSGFIENFDRDENLKNLHKKYLSNE